MYIIFDILAYILTVSVKHRGNPLNIIERNLNNIFIIIFYENR